MERTFLRPNRHTIGLAAIVLAMWYAGASQANAAAYLLGFFLVSVSAVSALHAWSNLRALEVTAAPIDPVFAGDSQLLHLRIQTSTSRSHPGLKIETTHFAPVSADAPQSALWNRTPSKRGAFQGLSLRLWSWYPLGFFTAQRRLWISQPFYIYPKPAGSLSLPHCERANPNAREGRIQEGEDFAGTRAYRLGESQRHIDWKAAARGQGLQVKQWTSEAGQILLLNWSQVSSLEWEKRLCQLAAWLVEAAREDTLYGLELPWQLLPPARGEAHYHACLRALASAPKEASRHEA